MLRYKNNPIFLGLLYFAPNAGFIQNLLIEKFKAFDWRSIESELSGLSFV
jgi:hypothetical protein